MSKRASLQPPAVCPVCGEEVPPRALACPECGADHNSGWRLEAASEDALGEADFDYDEFVRDEFGSSVKPRDLRTVWWLTALVVLIAMALFLFLAR